MRPLRPLNPISVGEIANNRLTLPPLVRKQPSNDRESLDGKVDILNKKDNTYPVGMSQGSLDIQKTNQLEASSGLQRETLKLGTNFAIKKVKKKIIPREDGGIITKNNSSNNQQLGSNVPNTIKKQKEQEQVHDFEIFEIEKVSLNEELKEEGQDPQENQHETDQDPANSDLDREIEAMERELAQLKNDISTKESSIAQLSQQEEIINIKLQTQQKMNENVQDEQNNSTGTDSKKQRIIPKQPAKIVLDKKVIGQKILKNINIPKQNSFSSISTTTERTAESISTKSAKTSRINSQIL